MASTSEQLLDRSSGCALSRQYCEPLVLVVVTGLRRSQWSEIVLCSAWQDLIQDHVGAWRNEVDDCVHLDDCVHTSLEQV